MYKENRYQEVCHADFFTNILVHFCPWPVIKIHLHLMMLQFSLDACGCSNELFEAISGKLVIEKLVFCHYARNLSSSHSDHKN